MYSKMMEALYGKDYALVVYNRCEELSPSFNKMVQSIVYDIFWARDGLSLRDKSLATIISLTVLKKAEQLEIHMRGFLHLGGSKTQLEKIMTSLKTEGYSASAIKGLEIIEQIFRVDDYEKPESENALSRRDQMLIKFCACIAEGENSKTAQIIELLLINKVLTREEMENIMLHQMLYCGFPCAMNGLSILQLQTKKPIK